MSFLRLSADSAQSKSHVARAQEFIPVGCKNYVRCRSLFVCKQCLGLLILFPTDTKISHEYLKFMVANVKGLEYGRQM